MSVEPITYGQGSFGFRCTVCGRDNYDTGKIEHTCGSAEQGRMWPNEPERTRVVLATFQDGSRVLTGATGVEDDTLPSRFPGATFEDVTPCES